jgi:hypothetical protein
MVLKTKRRIIRVDGKLGELVTVVDEKGKVLQKVLKPLMFEFYPRDVFRLLLALHY